MAATAVQWTIDQVYNGLRTIYDILNQVMADLNSNRAELQRLWAQTRTEDAATMAAHQAALRPLIHNNNDIRLTYVQPIVQKYKDVVARVSGALSSAGYTAPTLNGPPRTGLGLFGVDDIAAAGALVALCITAVVVVQRLTQAQINETETIKQIMTNANLTPDEKVALADKAQTAFKQVADDTAKGFPFPKWQDVLPVLGLVAILVFLPQIKALLPQRREA